jgi:hypothetical protein
MEPLYELVVIEQGPTGTAQPVTEELLALGSSYTLIELVRPATASPQGEALFHALARNQVSGQSAADWLVFLDPQVVLDDMWLEQLPLDLALADVSGSPMSIGAVEGGHDAGRRYDIAYRRDFLLEQGLFAVSPAAAGQEDLLMELRCLVVGRSIGVGGRRSRWAGGDWPA